MNAGVSFDALFAYAEQESAKWERWFQENPAAFDVRIDIADVGDAKGMLHHIFAVEQLYVERFHGEPTTPGDRIPRQPYEALFEVGRKARARLREAVAQMDDAALDQPITFMTRFSGQITASRRKCAAQALIHSIRHWAQLATELRRAGYKQPWSHDFLLSQAMT